MSSWIEEEWCTDIQGTCRRINAATTYSASLNVYFVYILYLLEDRLWQYVGLVMMIWWYDDDCYNDVVNAIQTSISRQYHHNWIVDNLPAASILDTDQYVSTQFVGYPIGDWMIDCINEFDMFTLSTILNLCIFDWLIDWLIDWLY